MALCLCGRNGGIMNKLNKEQLKHKPQPSSEEIRRQLGRDLIDAQRNQNLYPIREQNIFAGNLK